LEPALVERKRRSAEENFSPVREALESGFDDLHDILPVRKTTGRYRHLLEKGAIKSPASTKLSLLRGSVDIVQVSAFGTTMYNIFETIEKCFCPFSLKWISVNAALRQN
jgi:hypothetical protein